MSPTTGWLIRAVGSPTDLPRIVEALAGGVDLSAEVNGCSLHLRSSAIDRLENRADAEWAAYEFVRLISASLRVRGLAVFLEFQSIEAKTDVPIMTQLNTERHRNGAEELSVAMGMNAAHHREQVRCAFFGYADGGAEGLFRAYEALTYELMDTGRLDYAGGVGTREWLIQQGWVTEPEEARFLDTILHYGRQNSAPP